MSHALIGFLTGKNHPLRTALTDNADQLAAEVLARAVHTGEGATAVPGGEELAGPSGLRFWIAKATV